MERTVWEHSQTESARSVADGARSCPGADPRSIGRGTLDELDAQIVIEKLSKDGKAEAAPKRPKRTVIRRRRKTAADADGEAAPVIEETVTRVKIPPGTESGKQFRLKGKGMPVLRTKMMGDMYIQVDVETPLAQALDRADEAEGTAGNIGTGEGGDRPRRRVRHRLSPVHALHPDSRDPSF